MIDWATRRDIRQEVGPDFGDGLLGTTTSLGATTTLNDTSRAEATNFWRGGDVLLLPGSGSNDMLHRLITASTTSVSLTTAAFPAAVANACPYELYTNFTVDQYNNAIKFAVERTHGNHWLEWFYNGLTIAASTYDYALPYRFGEVVITADVGSLVTALISATSLAQANNFWNGARCVCLTATNAANLGVVRDIVDFNTTTDTLSFDIPYPAVITSGDTFQILRFAPSYIHFVEYIPSGETTPVVLRERDWEIVHRNGPMIRFIAGACPPVDSEVRLYGVRPPEPPTHDRHPVEVPRNYAIDLAYWQILRSRPRRAEFKLNEDSRNKDEAYESAMKSLALGRMQRPQEGKKVQ